MNRLTKLVLFGLPFTLAQTYAHFIRDLGEELVTLTNEIGTELKLEPEVKK